MAERWVTARNWSRITCRNFLQCHMYEEKPIHCLRWGLNPDVWGKTLG